MDSLGELQYYRCMEDWLFIWWAAPHLMYDKKNRIIFYFICFITFFLAIFLADRTTCKLPQLFDSQVSDGTWMHFVQQLQQM